MEIVGLSVPKGCSSDFQSQSRDENEEWTEHLEVKRFEVLNQSSA